MTTERRAIYTIAVGDAVKPLADLTLPRMQSYARECGAEFIVVDQWDSEKDTPHFAKFDIIQQAKHQFDRMLFLDADVLILKGTASIFDCYTCALHDEFDTPDGRPNPIVQLAMTELRRNFDPGFRAPYFNTGVMLLDRETLVALDQQLQERIRLVLWEQCQLNHALRKIGKPQQRLSRRWNYQYGWLLSGRDESVPADTCFLHFCGFLGDKTPYVREFL